MTLGADPIQERFSRPSVPTKRSLARRVLLVAGLVATVAIGAKIIHTSPLAAYRVGIDGDQYDAAIYPSGGSVYAMCSTLYHKRIDERIGDTRLLKLGKPSIVFSTSSDEIEYRIGETQVAAYHVSRHTMRLIPNAK